MALTDLTRISTSGIATGTSLSGAILHGDAHFRGTQVGVTSALFDSSDDALELSDNVKLTFGNDGDLKLYHSGSHSFIDETGMGNLYIRNGSKNSIFARSDGEVILYHNDSSKFKTAETGAVVTGVLTATSFSGPIIGSPINNPSGISTFYDLRVSNNLTVEGTTTTLDTNLIGVDRVEVGANSNTVTGIAVTQSGTADIVRLYDGASQVVTIDDTGNVGIGSDIPTQKLDVAGKGRFSDDLIILNGKILTLNNTANTANVKIDCDGGARLNVKSYDKSVIQAQENWGVRFFQGNEVERLAIEPTGGIVVGVGGTIKIPDKMMHVGDEDTYLQFTTNTINLHSGGTTGLTVYDTNVRIPTKLGINGAVPSTPLDVIANASGYAMAIRGRSSDNVGEIRFTSNDYGSALYSSIQTGPTYLNIQVGSVTNALRIASGGQVFIGKISGDHILDINASNSEIRLSKASASDYTGIQLDRDASGNAGGYFGLAGNTNHYITGSAQHDICIRSEANLVFSAGGGTEKLRITSAGTLKFTGQNTSLETAGITHHTNNNLYIRGGTSGLVLGNHDNTNTIHISNSDFIKFETTDGSERVRITSGGYIHAGNTSHGTNKVGGQAITGQDYDPYFKLYASTSNHWLMQLRSDSTSGNGIFLRSGNSSSTYTLYATGYDENNPHFIVRGDGKIGIGTNNPATLLHIDDDSVDPYLRIGGSGRDCGIQLSANANYTAFRADGANRLFVNAGADSIRFSIGGATSSNEKVRITSGGRVGIKNTLASTFDSNSNTLCIGDGGGAVGLTFYTAASADGSHISFTETTGSTSEGMISYYQGAYSSTNDRDCMVFKANSSEKFRITKHGVRQFRGGYSTSTNSNSTWSTLFTFSDAGTNGFSMVCAVAENSYTTMYRVAGSVYWNSCYFTSDYAGDSGHAHSSDIEFRILNDSGTKRLQFKAVSYTTTRQITVISVWLKNGYAIWA